VAARALLAGAAGCNRSDTQMGPAQQAGKAVDDTGAKVADTLHAQIDKANEAAQQVAKSADETRDRIKDATEDASRGLDKATEQVGKKVERAGEKIQRAAH
jgi:methyl-accepting chemotaxis protein